MEHCFQGSPIIKHIFNHARESGEKEALIFGEERISYNKLAENILKAAYYLSSIGLVKNDKIILAAEKNPLFIYLYFGSQLLGVVNVIVDPDSTEDRLGYVENKVYPKIVFGHKSNFITNIAFSEINISSCPQITPNQIPIISEEDIAEIIFTTGTTGDPKGVCLSHANIYSSAQNINAFIGNTTQDREVIALPICHSFGLGRIRCNLLAGSTIVFIKNFGDVRKFFKIIEEFRITGFSIVPAAWNYIRKISGLRLKKYAEQIKFIEIGSAPMSLETKKELLEIFPDSKICMHYGLTEASRSSFIEFHDTNHLNSIGKPSSKSVDIQIFNSEGQRLSDNEIGELCISGKMVCNKYLGESSEDHFRFESYIRTGDLGYRDSEGYFYLVGREKEIINVGGKKVSPSEIEDTICSIGVGDCICIPMKDNLMGERVKCYILSGSTELSFEEINKILSEIIEPYKLPAEYEWIDAIPKTQSGKKQRLKLIN